MKDQLSKYLFYSFAKLKFEYEDSKQTLSFDEDSSIIVDLTNVVKDNHFYKNYIENYIYILQDNVSEIHICIQEQVENQFLETYPFLIDKENIVKTFIIDKTIEEKLQAKEGFEHYKRTPLISNNDIYPIEGDIINLSELVESSTGFHFTLKDDLIIEEKIIELTSISKTLNARSDLRFNFEMIFNELFNINNNLKFTIDKSEIKSIIESLPFTFKEDHSENITNDKVPALKDKEKDTGEIIEILDKVFQNIKGHKIFKADFKSNLLKFKVLNNINQRKILSVFICGQSGLGKTEFAKNLSRNLYPEEKLIKINFGNYSTEGVLNSLIGSPKGYIGSEEGGELISKIKNSKSKIILIDEFEKATESVFNFFYELLEDGKFTDRLGYEHDLNKYIIIFTSNLTKNNYSKFIPDALNSRFDMVSLFQPINKEEKETFIKDTAIKLIETLNVEYNKSIELKCIYNQLMELVKYNNLRDIKRMIEDIVVEQFFKEELKGLD